VIATDFLADVLGYDKYGEITTEFSVRSTFCDLAVKVQGELAYLIEVNRPERISGKTTSGKLSTTPPTRASSR